MKEHPILFNGAMVAAIQDGRKTQTRRVVKGARWVKLVAAVLGANAKWVWDTFDYELTTPFGRPGDRLWVRETFWDHGKDFEPDRIEYRVDEWNRLGDGGGWKPSIHMKRWQSRINLLVKAVRVERVREISEEDAQAEGPSSPCECGIADCGNPLTWCESFEKLWPSTIKKKDLPRFGWAANPWVWVVEFDRLTVATSNSELGTDHGL